MSDSRRVADLSTLAKPGEGANSPSSHQLSEGVEVSLRRANSEEKRFILMKLLNMSDSRRVADLSTLAKPGEGANSPSSHHVLFV